MSNLVIRPDQQGFTPQQLATLKQLGVEKVSEGDLGVFFHQCQRTGLDPFAKQIYMVGRWDGRANAMRYTIQTGIDGYRLIAERTGVYAGSDESWVEKDGKPVSATVTVRKVVAGQVCEFTATARWEEYVQLGKDSKPMGLWSKMPHRMLAKCAEALALRKAFPQDLSGLYTTEEMAQADAQPEPQRVQATRVDAPQADADPLVSVENLTRFREACKKAGLSPEQVADNAGVTLAGLRESEMPALRAAFKDLQSFAAPDNAPEPPSIDEMVADLAEQFGGEIIDAEVIEDAPKPKPSIKEPGAPASKPQIGAIMGILKDRNVTDRREVLEVCSEVVGRVLGSFDEMTKGDASKVISYLKGE